jgi:hypothetical protein
MMTAIAPARCEQLSPLGSAILGGSVPVDLKIALARGAEQLATHWGSIASLIGGEDRSGTALTRAQRKPTIALE